MTKMELIDKLASLPELIEAQEKTIIVIYGQVQECKRVLTEAEDDLLLSGAIDGKNAEIRAAQMRVKTPKEQESIRVSEKALSVERVKLNRLNNELAVCQAIAGMLKGAE